MKILYVGKQNEFTDNLLKTEGFKVEIRRDEVDALRLLEEGLDFDLVCAEYDLPIRNGLNFLKKLKSRKKTKNLASILLQKEYDQEVLRKAFSYQVDDYYPLDSVHIDQIIQRMISFKNIEFLKVTEKNTGRSPFSRLPWSKRLFDIVVASLLLILLSPILLITIIAIRIESKGKVYYTAKRVGRKTFDFYKFRSMKVGADSMLKELAETNNQYAKNKVQPDSSMKGCSQCAELPEGEFCSPLIYDGQKEICEKIFIEKREKESRENSSFIKIADDPRITKIGKFIRNTSIDELPQLINVIKGDMSLVGNRPLPVYEAETLTKDQLSKRFLAPAGITGLWQVELRGKGGEMSEEERIELDNQYADLFTNNQYSFWYDIKILLRTVPALFQQSTV